MQTAFNVSTFIKNRLDLSERQKTTSTFIQGAVLLVLCVALAPKVWYVGIAAMVAAAYLLLVNIRNAHRLTPELKYDAKKFSIDSVKELVSSGIWNSINNLGNVLNSGLDLIITNLMLTATAMGQISVAKNLATICYTLVGTIILCVDCLIVGVCALLVEFIVLFDRNEISEFARKVKNKIA